MATSNRAATFVLTAVLALASVSTAPRPSPAHTASAVQVLARPGGQPDDIAVDARGRLLWGDLASNTLERLQGGKVVTIARNIPVPEGIVARPNGVLFVAAQGSDQILRLSPNGTRSLVFALSPVPGQEGVDGIGQDARTGELLIPDSPRGTVLRISPNRRQVRTLARGLGRPVAAAIGPNGSVLVPDEHLNTLVQIAHKGTIRYRGALSTPDDVAVDGRGNVWVTSLGDGGLWFLAPGRAPRRILSNLANPQGLTLDRCGDPIIVEQNTASIVRLLLTARARGCKL